MQSVENDYFALEEHIIAQLKTISNIEEVYTHFSIEDMISGVAIKPSVSVIYLGDRVADGAGNGKASIAYQQWLIVLAVEDAGSQLENTVEIRKSASPIILKILKAMQGYQAPVLKTKSFQRVSAGVEPMFASGAIWLPFLFEAQIINSF